MNQTADNAENTPVSMPEGNRKENDMEEKKKGFFSRLVEGLNKTRENIVSGIDSIFSGFSAIDDDFYEELEETLIMGDIGIQTTMTIMEDLRKKVKEQHIKDPSQCKQLLIDSIRSQMDLGENAYEFENRQSVVLVIGVNGVGKTTSVGKLAGQLKDEGKKVVLAAADTFRAAAIEQLTEWANRAGVEIIAQQEIHVSDLTGGHSCSVTNADRFLQEYSGALGIKTGYTNRAGHCFVGAAERDGVRLVSAVLGSGWGDVGKQKKWTDTKALMDYGFAAFHPYEAVQAGERFGEIRITDSPTAQMEAILAEGYTALFSDAEIEKLHLTADLPKELAAPVHRGERLGQAVLWLGEERLAAVDLLAAEDAEPFTLRERLLRLAEGWLSWRD